MAATIEIASERPGEFTVTIIDGARRTSHTVVVDGDYRRKLTGGKAEAVDLVRRSFEFLLAREPQESILGRFGDRTLLPRVRAGDAPRVRR